MDPVFEGILLVRAKYQCEYCHRRLAEVGWQKEHIWPESRGGSSNQENLAVSCPRCNNNKCDHVEWIDPMSGGSFPLFNPRTMTWAEHFKLTHDGVVGTSEIGGATASLLFGNTPQYLPRDLSWDKLQGLYENQSLYYFLNHLRYKRLRNDFSALYKQLIAPLPPADATPQEQQIANFARDLLLIELFFTRSRLEDVSKGILHCENLLSSSPQLGQSERAEILNMLSIFYQQRATIYFGKGHRKKAKADQETAFKFYAAARQDEYDETLYGKDPHQLAAFLRAKTLRSKYGQIELVGSTIDTCFQCIGDLDPFYATSHYTYLVDLVLLSPNSPKRLVERLYQRITEILRSEGYGTTTDYAKLITLRRRWWVLHFIMESKPDHDALIADMAFWRKVLMFNEIRELDSYVARVFINEGRSREIRYIINDAHRSS